MVSTAVYSGMRSDLTCSAEELLCLEASVDTWTRTSAAGRFHWVRSFPSVPEVVLHERVISVVR